MGLDNPIHLMFLLVVLLLVFGAKRLPELGQSLGTGLRGFKDAIGGDSVPTSLSAMAHQQMQPHAPVASTQPAAAVTDTQAPVPAVETPAPTAPLTSVQSSAPTVA